MEYKKKSDGNHFYRIGENILHVAHFRSDDTIIEKSEFITTTYEVRKNQCCINTIDNLPNENLIDISKEEFYNEIREVIFILGIYEYAK